LKNGIENPEKQVMFCPMKMLFLIPLFFGSALVLPAQTAASALAVIEKEKGPTFVDNLFEVKGQRGEPQPQAWTFRFNDPAARGGLREIVVQGGQILSERTPVRGFGGTGDLPTLKAKTLNLDSRAVFQTANQAAVRQGLGFHWLDYALRPDVQSGQPVWFLTFIDVFGARAGDIGLDGRTLKVVEPLRLDPGVSTGLGTVGSSSPTHGEADAGFTPGGAIGKSVDFIFATRRTVHRAIFGSIGAVQEWLTGERTIGTGE